MDRTSYSTHNQAYGRMMQSRADERIKAEVDLARQIIAQTKCSRSDALRAAYRILERA